MRYLLWIFAFIITAPALALDASAPILYSRASIPIVRGTPPSDPLMPWQDSKATPQTQEPSVVFDTEVRDAMTLYKQDGWYNLSSPQDTNAILLMFSAPGIAPIEPSAHYAALDILMIDEQGKILQIVPNVKLSALEQEILPESPILAFMFLRGGLCEKLSIQPGDHVQYKLFKKPPTVLTAPTAPKKQESPTIEESPAAVEDKAQQRRDASPMVTTP